MGNERSKIVTLVGTNASGKSAVGIELAKTFQGEIISADSRQIYKGFDLCFLSENLASTDAFNISSENRLAKIFFCPKFSNAFRSSGCRMTTIAITAREISLSAIHKIVVILVKNAIKRKAPITSTPLRSAHALVSFTHTSMAYIINVMIIISTISVRVIAFNEGI